MTVNWNLETARYGLQFQTAFSALFDDSQNPVQMLYNFSYISYSMPDLYQRYQNATTKGGLLEIQYGLPAGSLTQALVVGDDLLSGVASWPSYLVDLCGPSQSTQLTCAAGQSYARNQLLSARSEFTTFFDVLQQIEAAANPVQAPVPAQAPVSVQQAPVQQIQTSIPVQTSGVVTSLSGVVQFEAGPVISPIAAGLISTGPVTLSVDDVNNLVTFANIFHEIAQSMIPELTYQGTYRRVLQLQIPAGVTNYEVDIGFPARVFRLNTEWPILVRLQNIQADPIYLDHETGPLDINRIPASLAFSTFYVTNSNNFIIYLNLFVMG